MSFSVRVLPKQRLAIIFYASDVSRSDFDDLWQELQRSPDFEWDFDEIAVFSPDAELAGLNFESVNAEAQRFKSAHESVELARDRRSAIVVSNQVQVIGARMFLAFVASNPPPHVEFKLFNKVSPALSWIEADRPSGDVRPKIDHAEIEKILDELDRARRDEVGKSAKALAR